MLIVDLEKQKIISEDSSSIDFDIDEFRKKCLLEGLDDIGLTLQKKEKITEYETKLQSSHPWII
jgi:3-isopropylmalate/(R)-2-methylmalate dehydratase small subunit